MTRTEKTKAKTFQIRKKQRQIQKPPQRFEDVDRVTPYQFLNQPGHTIRELATCPNRECPQPWSHLFNRKALIRAFRQCAWDLQEC